MFEIKYTDKFIKQLNKIDPNDKRLIVNWINKNLDNTDNPYKTGKALVGNLKGLWRYRIGKYRVIVKIENQVLEIYLLRLGLRKDIYKQG